MVRGSGVSDLRNGIEGLEFRALGLRISEFRIRFQEPGSRILECGLDKARPFNVVYNRVFSAFDFWGGAGGGVS